MSDERAVSRTDAIANSYVERYAELVPESATIFGIPGFDHRLSDYSPAGLEAVNDLTVEVLDAIRALDSEGDGDRTDATTRAAMIERLSLEVEQFEALIPHSLVNNITSPIQRIRSIFDLMPQETAHDWLVISERLAHVPAAVRGYEESLKYAADCNVIVPARQQRIGADAAHDMASTDGFFASLGQKSGLEGHDLSQLEERAAAAREAYEHLSTVLEDLAERAPEKDAVGRDAYLLHSRAYIGDTIDIDEAYAFGIAELTNLVARMREVSARINTEYSNGGGDSIEAAVASLNADTSLTIHGTDNLKSWMQGLSDRAIAELADEHFDIPDELRALECCIAETGAGGIYYTGPSEDFSRPGRMWWDTPQGVDTFQTWKETTTVYHEGVPGHHLQIGTQTLQGTALNRWRSLMCWISGHGEGWALYAERLMDQLGYLTTDAERLGMLSEQRMRAARVVLDIGFHNELPVPDQFGGGEWTYERAWEFVQEHWSMEQEPIQRFELHRYLGWPGQAPSYKLGQRVWEKLRDNAAGRGESIKDFYRRALELGALPLSVLRDALEESL